MLLLTWADPDGSVATLRRRLRARFPGASPKQPFTVHTSLWRIVGPPGVQLGADAVRALSDEARRWTEQVGQRPGGAAPPGAKAMKGCEGLGRPR